MNDLDKAAEAYIELFGEQPPMPFGASEWRLAEILNDAVKRGEPIPEDFDWWGDLPEGADA